MPAPDEPDFLASFGLRRGDIVALTGAGGKTSLMFRLAREGRAAGLKVLVTTSTRIRIPSPEEYDALDLGGDLFAEGVVQPGLYVGGRPAGEEGKLRGVRDDLLAWRARQFDLVLIEADGAATKPLKGWRANEPVIPECTSATIGVVAIDTIGRTVDDSLVHRLELFTHLTGAEAGDTVSLGHLLRLIVHDDGLFAKALGRELLFLARVESATDRKNAVQLSSQLESLRVVIGSTHEGVIHG